MGEARRSACPSPTARKTGQCLRVQEPHDAWRRNGHEQLDNLAPEHKPRPVPRDTRERGPWRFTLTGWWYAGGLATLVVLLAAAFLSYRTSIHRPSGSARRGKFSWLTTLPGAELAPAFSPDGKTIAFAWRAPEGSGFDLYTKTIGSDEVHRLTWRSSRMLWPAWSPGRSQNRVSAWR